MEKGITFVGMDAHKVAIKLAVLLLRVNYSCRCATTRFAGPGQGVGCRGDLGACPCWGRTVAPL
jgi:hypothetical protein